MNIQELVAIATAKSNFLTLEDYIRFARSFLEFSSTGLQAIIVSQNEPRYRFFQFGEDGYFSVTRPINSALFFDASEFDTVYVELLAQVDALLNGSSIPAERDDLFARSIYTIQQCIGATLDALPAGKSNTARKINGDLFERLIRLIIQRTGVRCSTGTYPVRVPVDDGTSFDVKFQHDILIYREDELRVIGSVKTSSKDRLDKIFMDKFLYSRLTETALPHIAIFLNDVQRKRAKSENRFGISSTFLPGHFRGFTVKLNALDGVYYCDLRPSMENDPFLYQHIHSIDQFFTTDLRVFVGV